MSWFGEHLSSFTEKISDLTKDILPESGSNTNNGAGPLSEAGAQLSTKHLFEICKEKDAEISSLMSEKISLERSIEELDGQHQEVIGELLHLKNEAVKENLALKEMLASQKENQSIKSIFQKFEHNYQPKELNTNEVNFMTDHMYSNSLKSFNLVNIIGVLWKNFSEASICSILQWLNDQKLLLEGQTPNVGGDDKCNSNVVHRINIYIEFLKLMSENPKLFSYIIDEIATVINFLISDHLGDDARFSVPERRNSENNSSTCKENAAVDSTPQALIENFKYVKDLFSTTPTNLATQTEPGDIETSLQHVQTDGEDSVKNCDSLTSELQQNISILEQDKLTLLKQLSGYEKLLSDLQQRLQPTVPSSSVHIQTEYAPDGILGSTSGANSKTSATQTENIENDSNKLMELQVCVDVLEQEKSDLLDEIQTLKTVINKSTISSLTQTDNYVCDRNVHELEACICILEQDKADLQEEIDHLKSSLDKSMSSVAIQTDENSNHCELLESEISNLQQLLDLGEKDYNNSMLEMNRELDILREDLNVSESCISDGQNKIQSLENKNTEYGTIIDELTVKLQKSEEDMDNLKEKLKHDQCSISEKENVIQFLESELQKCQIAASGSTEKAQLADELVDLEMELKLQKMDSVEKEIKIKSLENENVEYRALVDSLSVKLQQANEDISYLKDELKDSEDRISGKEDTIQFYQSELEKSETARGELIQKAELAEDLVKLEKELKSKKSDLQEQLNKILVLEQEIEEYKTIVNSLNADRDELHNLKEELNGKDSIIQEKDDQIKFLEKDLEDHKAMFDNLMIRAEKMVSDCNSLKEIIQSKEYEVQQKISIIKSLEYNLEQYKAALEKKAEKLQETAVQTSLITQTAEKNCSCELYESKISELEQSLWDKEKEYNNTQNQSIINIKNLKEQLTSYENLIADKDSALVALNTELEKCRITIKDLSEDVKLLKESSLTKASEIPCSCKNYESELEDLKICLTAKEKEFVAVEDSLTNLQEILQSKDLIVIDKEETIQTLKMELEETKRIMKKQLNDEKTFKAKQDYAKDIDTLEEQIIMGNCNRCNKIINRELNDNDLKNEVQVLQDRLKALELDKNQLLCVLNEKSQECSSLKSEVHKLTNIVASEKQALYKLQQDNCLLKESRDTSDPELTKEAIQKLSGIIRDKDLEIESLKQKSTTLTTLIQSGTSVPDHLQSLIEENENLKKQIGVFMADRDKIMARYNSIDKDCRSYAAEVKKLQSDLSEQKEKFDVLEQKHFSVAQQYEEKQKSLINTQNEMIALKQRVSDLEQQQVDIKEKYGELLNKLSSDAMVQLPKDELERKNSQIEQLMSAASEKDHLIEEKDCLIHNLSQQIKALKLEHEQQQVNLSNLQVKFEELNDKCKEHEALVDKYQNEKEALEMRFQDKNSELGLLKEMNERLNMNLKEKEFTIQSMTEKISSLSHYISSDHTTSDTVDINQILADSQSMFSRAQSLYKERDETLLALNQSKQENQSLRNEIQRMKSSEIHLKKELERLRMHLLEIEENYTSEALKAEEREKALRDELVTVKRRAEISNTAIVDTNQRASIQIASLQEQLSIIASQRDQALAQVSTLEDKVQQHSTSVSKLQLVLEQMQRGNERKIKEAERKLLSELEKQKQFYRELEEKLRAKEMQLEESTQALEAASRLSEQLDAKEEIIAHLKSELLKTESKFKSTAQEIDTIKSNTEGKVDRVVMKSLVLGYFSTPPGQKSEVIRLLARVLDFNQEEMEKAGIVVGRNAQRNEQRGYFSSLFSRLPIIGAESTTPPPEQSFTIQFVQFLQNESQPIVPMPFPAEQMAQDSQRFSRHISHNRPLRNSPTHERRTLTGSNPLLLDIDSAFPTFTPVPAVEYSSSPGPSILREVLE